MSVSEVYRVERVKRYHSTRILLLAGVSLLALGSGSASAEGPTSGNVVRGKATISQQGAVSRITQTSRRAVIEWESFNVGREASVVFDQPGRDAATLNRVTSASRSVIEGTLSAPGTIIIQNTAGVLFTDSAKVDATALVATSQRVNAELFQTEGRLSIGGGEKAGASVVNNGEITIGEAGLAALVGTDVRNAGVIVAERGKVALASGQRSTIDLSGDGTVQIAVDGHSKGGGARNTGLIDAAGGTVILTAGAAASAVESVINTSGIIRAGGTADKGGKIRITARGKGRIALNGSLDASNPLKGGAISVAGSSAIVVGAAARITANGGHHGGSLRVGGDFGGKGPLPRAGNLRIEQGAELSADGTSGAGGSIVAWSDGTTEIGGTLSATGGEAGGTIETSGRFALGVGIHAAISLGEGGSWLLDPRDVRISTYGTPVAPGTNNPADGSGEQIVNGSSVVAVLRGGSDVTITTDAAGTPGSDTGNIIVDRQINWTGSGSLTLEAAGGIVLEKGVSSTDGSFTAEAGGAINVKRSITTHGDGSIALEAGDGITVSEDISASGSGGVSLLATGGDIRIGETSTGNVLVSTATGALDLAASEGDIVLHRAGRLGAAHIQVRSASGPLSLTAGNEIHIEGGEDSASWVRVGSSTGSSEVTLSAPTVTVAGGTHPNSFAEVVTGAGGALTIEGETFALSNGGGDIGMVAALDGADLTISATHQRWDGYLRAGSGASDGGNVLIEGSASASVEPEFSLAENRSFRLAPGADGAAINATVPITVTTSGGGTIDVEGLFRAPALTLASEEQVALGPDAQLVGSGRGDAVVVAAGRSFENTAGTDAIALEAAGSRWLLYINRFDGLEGGEPQSHGFDLYGRPYPTTPPSAITQTGNRIVYGEQPTLTLTADSLTKSYGSEAEPGYSASGLRNGDSLATALISGPNVMSDGSETDADTGTYITRVSATQSSQGYRLVVAPGAMTVERAPLTITADSTSRTYGGANPAFSATGSGFVLGQSLDDLDGSLGFETAATRRSDTGRYGVTASGLASRNYDITYAPGTLTIDPAALTITADSTSRTYGGANPAFSATGSGFVLGQSLDDLDGSLGFETAATRRSDTGRYGVTASGLASRNYDITYAPGTLTIDPAALTITADSTSRTYGGANPAFSATGSGFVLGQSLDDLDGSLGFETAATRRSDTGRYGVTASGLASRNYDITYAPGTLTIDPAALTITADSTSRTYGGANPAFSATGSGFVLGQSLDDLDGSLGFETAATRRSDTGRYGVTASGLASRNYDITYAPGTLTIDPAALTITADSTSRTYGGANPAFSATGSGFVLGQSLDDLDGSLGFETAATRRSDTGRYGVTASGLASRNYDITYAPGTLTIDPAALTITADSTSRTYGGANPAFSATGSGFVLGQSLDDLDGSLGFETAATRRSDTGRYGVTASGLASRNYDITYAPGTLTIDPAALTITADSTSRTYGGANPAFSATGSGFVLGQSLDDLDGSLGFETAATRRSDTGRYGVTASGLASRNYDITYAPGTLTIDPAALTITADSTSRTYGGANPAFSATGSGFVLGQSLDDLDGSLGFETAATRRSDTGRYGVTASGLASRNYDITYAPGTLTIDPAALTITADSTSRTYGGANPAFSATGSGFVLGQSLDDLDGSLGFETAATRRSDTGRYGVTASGLASRNYDITYAPGTLTIDPAALTITADSTSRTYGGANPAFSATGSGFVLGQSLDDLDGSLGFETAATRRSDTGRYGVTASGLASRNYDITYAPGTLTIDPAALTITADSTSRTYGGANPAFSATGSGFVLGQSLDDLDGSLGFETAATRRSDTGRYGVTASGLASRNYDITYAPGTLTIDPAALTITADSTSRTYGGANPAFSATGSGFVLGQSLDDLDGSLGFETAATRRSDTGRYGVTASGLASRNYDITYAPGTLTIDPAALTITADSTSRTYGGANPAFSATGSGFVLGQSLDDLDGSLGFETAATRRSDTGRYGVTASGLASRNYDITYAPGTLTIDPAALTITADSTSRTYGGANPAFSATGSGFVLGQSLDDLDGSLGFETAATRRSDTGRYGVTASGLASRNYDITYAPGTLTIDPAALTITADSTSRTYGGANPAFSATGSGFVLGQSLDDLDGSLGFETAATRRSDTGRYGVTASGLASRNYDITYAPGTLTIDPAALTITADSATRTEGAANPDFTVSGEGFVNGEDVGDLGGTLIFATDATSRSGPGSYSITPDGLTSGNYSITYESGRLTVEPAGGGTDGGGTGGGGEPMATLTDASGAVERFSRGVPPLTPGDASFRTTQLDAPPAIANTFGLDYSLGEVIQLAPGGGAPAEGFSPASGTVASMDDADGFRPASGSATPAAAPQPVQATGCSGSINTGAADASCGRSRSTETYWTTRTPASR